jgi:ATP-binding cassette, subfamily B, multidrug efflux pump
LFNLLWILNYLKKYSRGYWIGGICLVLVNILAAYIPQLVKISFDKLEALSGFLNISEMDKIMELNDSILTLVIWIVALALVMAFFRISSRQIIFGIGRQIEVDLKKDIFNHLVKMEPEYFEKRRTGDLISIATNDVQAIRGLGGFAMLNLANSVFAFITVLPLMFALHVNLTWSFLSIVPCIILLIITFSDKIKSYQNIVQERLGELSGFIEQNLSGIHIIKSYGQEENEVRRFVVQNEILRSDYLRLAWIRSFIGPLMRVLASIGFVLLLYFGGEGVIKSSFSTGDFAAYSLYIQRLIWPVTTLGWIMTMIYRAEVSQKRIADILDVEPVIKDTEDSISKKDFRESLIISDCGVTINKPSTVAIVGTIGAGKSVLAHKLMHLKPLEDNEFTIDGVDLKKIILNDLRTLINLVPQENFLFSTSIFNNISYAKDLSREEVIELAKLVNIHDEILSFKNGYETIVGERGITLSGGQRQRIAIARALALDSEILILDDALSSLDDNTAKEILSKILIKRKNKTTIFITHKIGIIENFDQILVMDKLKIVEAGTHEELLNKNLYRQLRESLA